MTDRWKAWRPGIFTNRQSEILAKGQRFDELMAERDALAERADALHKALQAVAIERVGESNFELCRVCKALCDIAYPFQHKEGCLAAPSAPKEADADSR